MSSSSWSHLLCWVWCVFLPAAFGYPRDFHPVFFAISPGEGPESVVQRILSASMPSPVGQFCISECFEQKCWAKKQLFLEVLKNIEMWENMIYILHYLIIYWKFWYWYIRWMDIKQIDTFFCFGLMDLVVTFGDPRMDEFQLISIMLS